jgi:hypothetical protein
MNILILGHARHGKDTVAEMISKITGWKFMSSSWIIAEEVAMPYLEARGIEYDNVHMCYEDRANHRALWHDAIAEYNRPDGARLGKLIFQESRMYVGLRSLIEWQAMKDQNIIDYGIWVDRSRYMKPESSASMKLGPYAADFVVDNNGSLGATEKQCEKIVFQYMRFVQNTELIGLSF